MKCVEGDASCKNTLYDFKRSTKKPQKSHKRATKEPPKISDQIYSVNLHKSPGNLPQKALYLCKLWSVSREAYVVHMLNIASKEPPKSRLINLQKSPRTLYIEECVKGGIRCTHAQCSCKRAAKEPCKSTKEPRKSYKRAL